MNKTVLVTGAAGFIGSHLCEQLLSQGCHVVGVDNFSDFYAKSIKQSNLDEKLLAADAFQFHEVDICDRPALAKVVAQHRPGTIVHLAAMAGVRPSIENPAIYTAVNLGGTTNLLDAAVEQGVQKFVFASSSSVYGNNQKVPFAEQDRVDHPISPYAATKKAGELLCHAYSHLHSLSITCLRFFTVYGPRQRPDLAISKFMRLIAEGKPIAMYGDGTTSRDYTYIEDILQGLCAAMDKQEKFGIYNLGGNQPVTLTELITAIEQTVQKNAIINRQPMQPGDVQRTYADLTLSRSALNYLPKTSLREGLAKQWQWQQD
jgi:UDP-glucuronate 4-epimerase